MDGIESSRGARAGVGGGKTNRKKLAHHTEYRSTKLARLWMISDRRSFNMFTISSTLPRHSTTLSSSYRKTVKPVSKLLTSQPYLFFHCLAFSAADWTYLAMPQFRSFRITPQIRIILQLIDSPHRRESDSLSDGIKMRIIKASSIYHPGHHHSQHQASAEVSRSYIDKMGWEGRAGIAGRGSSDRELYFVDLPLRRRWTLTRIRKAGAPGRLFCPGG